MEKKLKKVFNIVAIICIIILSVSVTTKTLQNDTFYSIAIGRNLITMGTIYVVEAQMDIFSQYGYDYTYPHWLYDWGLGMIYNFAGFDGIYASTVILSIILGISIYLVSKKISKNEITSFVFTIVAMVLLRPYITARAQLVTFILFLMEVFLIETFISYGSKGSKLIPILLAIIGILIANLHAAVWPFFIVLFLPYVAEYAVSKIILLKNYYIVKNDNPKIEFIFDFERLQAERWLIILCVLYLLTGLVTPAFGVPYTYLAKILIGNSMVHIQEHQPLVLAENLYAIIIFAIYLGILIFSKIKFRLKDLFMTAGLLILSIFTQRQFSLFVLIGGLTINNWLSELLNTSKQKYDIGRTNLMSCLELATTNVGIVSILLFTILYSAIFYNHNKNSEYIDTSLYPVKAAEWMKNNLTLRGNRIYNEYDFGSYLMYDDVPVFIDSRADLYTPEFNKDANNFEDFFTTSGLTVYYEDTFEKYNIRYVLIYNNSVLNIFLSHDDNYKVLYKDESFVVYERETCNVNADN
jgi:hypothetical protein